MILLADEDFNARIVRGLERQAPAARIVSVQEIGLGGAEDSAILERAAVEGWVVLSHDARTMIAAANDRLDRGLPMPGLIIVRQTVPIGRAVSDLVRLIPVPAPEALDRRIYFVPF